jgi:hypothetical protein
MGESNPSMLIMSEGDVPNLVSQDDPLVGLETRVLTVWLENSPSLRRLYGSGQPGREDVENAVRPAVHQAHYQELSLRAQGMTIEQAQEFTRPAMWTPPASF